MLLTILTFAAEAAEHEESSKTLFYIAGGILTAYALGISAIGITQHGFPKTQGTARGVFALTAVLVAFAMASAVITG